LIVASGGGHSGFAKAVADYLPFKPDFVIPTGDSYSRKLLEPLANKIWELPKPREPLESDLHAIYKGVESLVQSSLLPKYKVILATGSNHSLLPSFFGYLKGSKVFAIESQDRIFTRGKAIRIISAFAKGVFLHWEEQRSLYKNGVVVGPILQRPRYVPKDEGYVFVTAGTEGFQRLFDVLAKLKLPNVILQTGKVNPERYKGLGWKVFDFDPDMEKYLANASLVITHQGKTAMEASILYNKSVIMVFNRSLVRATTFSDAKAYAEIIGATFMDDPNTWASEVELLNSINSPRRPKTHKPGTERLVQVILNNL